MKNFEKNFDRLLDNLKECTEILKECNDEMRLALSGAKSIRYAIADKNHNNFYNSDYNLFVLDIGGATLYKTKQMASAIMLEYQLNEDEFEIVTVSIKVVE